jgi:hypothetical protein
MSDLQARVEATGQTFDPDKIITVPLKNGAGSVDVYTGILPDEVYREALLQGLKVLAERAMSKMTKAEYPDDGERKVAIKAKAEANVEDMYKGKVKITGAAAVKKASGEVMIEAMRLARNLVKDAMKAEKIKINTVKASDITTAAKAFIAADPSIIATAEANLAARAEMPVKININSLIKADPELVRKAEAAAAAKKADKPLSAKQAGKVAPRAKSKTPPPVVETHHTAGHTAH